MCQSTEGGVTLDCLAYEYSKVVKWSMGLDQSICCRHTLSLLLNRDTICVGHCVLEA